MEKNNNPNMKPQQKPKQRRKLPNVDCEYAFRAIPISEARVQQIADEIEKYPDEDLEALTITPFLRKRGITSSVYYRLLHKYPFLKEAHTETMRVLGERLWERSVKSKYNWNAAKFMIHSYSPEFKEAKELEAAKHEQSSGITVVQVPAIPVPPKENDEK